MLLGPGPPPKRNRNANGLKERERALGTGGGSSTAGSSADTSLGVERGVTGESSGDPTPTKESGQGWNRKRYQREDEVLWGHELQEGEDKNDPNAARLRPATSSSSGNYYYPISPAVNDLHPPTISSLPANKSQMKWMLQPPPSAKIMAGKEPASSNRSRSDSGGSKGSSLRRGENSLGRLVGEKLMEEKRKRGEDAGSFVMMSRMSSKDSKLSKKLDVENEMEMGQRHDRDRLPMIDVQDNDHASKPPPVTTAAAGPAMVHEQRPPLSTIPSTSLLETTKNPQNPKSPGQGTMIPLGDIGNRQITTASSDSDIYETSPSPKSPDLHRDWKFPPMMDGDDVSPNAENERPLTR